MSAITGIFKLPLRAAGWVDDRMNPIVVKELRQAVKSRFVVAVLMLMLALLLLILTTTLIGLDTSRDFDDSAGAGLFMVFQGILLAVCMLFVPAYVGIRLAAERATVTSDLIYVTTIRPSSIIWGKLLAGMVVTVLIFSACAPFMVITYLLRGIDLPTILFVLALDALIVLAATQLAIFVGTMPIGWPVKTLLGLILLAASVMGFFGMTTWIAFEFVDMGIGSAMDEPDFWTIMAVFIGSWLAAVAMVFFLAVAMIAPPTANRALVPRLYFTLVWAGTFVGFFYITRQVQTIEPLVVWMFGALVALMLAAVISSSEREVLGPRMRRAVPRSPLLRVPAFFFYSGAAGGLLWVALLIVGTLGGTAAARSHFETVWSASSGFGYYSDYDPFIEHWLPRCLATVMWVYGYLLLAVIVCRRVFRMKNGVVTTGVTGLIIMALVSIVPMVVAFAMDPDRWDFNVEVWLLLNPFGPLFCNDSDWNSTYGDIAFPLSAVFFGLMVLVNVPWFARQINGFRPPPPEVTEPPPEVNAPPAEVADEVTRTPPIDTNDG